MDEDKRKDAPISGSTGIKCNIVIGERPKEEVKKNLPISGSTGKRCVLVFDSRIKKESELLEIHNPEEARRLKEMGYLIPEDVVRTKRVSKHLNISRAGKEFLNNGYMYLAYTELLQLKNKIVKWYEEKCTDELLEKEIDEPNQLEILIGDLSYNEIRALTCSYEPKSSYYARSSDSSINDEDYIKYSIYLNGSTYFFSADLNGNIREEYMDIIKRMIPEGDIPMTIEELYMELETIMDKKELSNTTLYDSVMNHRDSVRMREYLLDSVGYILKNSNKCEPEMARLRYEKFYDDCIDLFESRPIEYTKPYVKELRS